MEQKAEIDIEDDFYNANEYEDEYYNANEYQDEQVLHDQEIIPEKPQIPQDLCFNNPELEKFRSNLLERASSKHSSNYQQLNTGSYFDFKFSMFSRKLQNIYTEDNLIFSTLYSLHEFIKHFKNCNFDEKESREAGLTAYALQIKENYKQAKSSSKEKEFMIHEYEDLVSLLEEASAWRYENYTTDFPDIAEKDVEKELLKFEEEVKNIHHSIIKANAGLSTQDLNSSQYLQERIREILWQLQCLKISPNWHQKVYRRYHMRRELNKLMNKTSLIQNSKQILIDNKQKEYNGEVISQLAQNIQAKKTSLIHQKNIIEVSGVLCDAPSSFEVPLHTILEGTYFDGKLKFETSELEALQLKYGNRAVFKVIYEFTQVLNLSFNTVQDLAAFISSISELRELMMLEKDSIITTGDLNNDLLIHVLAILEDILDLMDEMIKWKSESLTNSGDVEDDRIIQGFKASKVVLSQNRNLLHEIKNHSKYVNEKMYIHAHEQLSSELISLLDIYLSVTNTYCLEEIDEVIKNIELSLVELKKTRDCVQINFKALVKSQSVSEFGNNMIDFDHRFTGIMTGHHRNQLRAWEKQGYCLNRQPLTTISTVKDW